MSDPDTGNNRATLPDVYNAVNDTRREVMEHIDALGTKFDTFVTTNEHRLSVLETHNAAQAEKISGVLTRLDEHGHEIGTLKDKQREDEAAQKALANSKNAGWTRHSAQIGWAISAIIAVGAILALILH